jgi:hypothetical protein
MATLIVPTQFPNITDAVNAASPNDIIQLVNGHGGDSAVVTKNNLIFEGDATSTGIALTLSNAAGADRITLRGGAGFQITGDAGNDTILLDMTSSALNVTVNGLGGDDRVSVSFAGDSNDLVSNEITGGDGAVGYQGTVDGNPDPGTLGLVTFSGTEAFEFLIGNRPTNLVGGDNDDFFITGNRDDNIVAGGGNDRLDVGVGGGVMDGGPGQDFWQANLTYLGSAVVFNFSLTGLQGTWAAEGGHGAGSVSNVEQVDLQTGSGSDNIILGRTVVSSSNVFSGDGDDTISPGGGFNVVNFGPGSDTGLFDYPTEIVNVTATATLQVDGSYSGIVNAPGSFFNAYAALETFRITTGNGQDNIATGHFNDLVSTGGNNDLINPGDGDNTIDGGPGSDVVIFADGQANYFLHTKLVGGTFVTFAQNDVTNLRSDLMTNVDTLRFAGVDLTLFGPQQNLTLNVDGSRFDNLVVYDTTTNQVLGKNAAGFFAFNDPTPGFTPVAVGDFNLDGRADVAIWNGTSGEVLVGARDLGGTLSYDQWALGMTGSFSPVAAADFDGDGAADLVAVDSATGSIYFRTSPNGAPGAWTLAGEHGVGFQFVGAGDFNNDGFADIAIEGPNDHAFILKIFDGANDGYIDLGNIPGFDIRGLFDTDADGFNELVAQRESDGWTVGLELSGGTPTWRILSDPVGTNLVLKGAADLDNDGFGKLLYEDLPTGQVLSRDPVAGSWAVETGQLFGIDAILTY